MVYWLPNTNLIDSWYSIEMLGQKSNIAFVIHRVARTIKKGPFSDSSEAEIRQSVLEALDSGYATLIDAVVVKMLSLQPLFFSKTRLTKPSRRVLHSRMRRKGNIRSNGI